jgi:hypothetical protein
MGVDAMRVIRGVVRCRSCLFGGLLIALHWFHHHGFPVSGPIRD